jgi:hypothetical protein
VKGDSTAVLPTVAVQGGLYGFYYVASAPDLGGNLRQLVRRHESPQRICVCLGSRMIL